MPVTPHAEVDIVVVGVGCAGSIVAAELTKAGLSVVGLERGPVVEQQSREESRDELAYSKRHSPLTQNAAAETWTLRHDRSERALPLRAGASFMPGETIGGSGIAWGGAHRRWFPHPFRMRSAIVGRRGESAIPADSTLQDWPLSYGDPW
jgi:gluconate 2-dehydrogenase alpha chain